VLRCGSDVALQVFHEHMLFFVGEKAQEFFFKTSEDIFNSAAAYKFTVPLFGKGVVYDGPPGERETAIGVACVDRFADLLIEERKIVGRGLSLGRFRQYVPMIEEEARWLDSLALCLMFHLRRGSTLSTTGATRGRRICTRRSTR
jgi:hypothetical protein